MTLQRHIETALSAVLCALALIWLSSCAVARSQIIDEEMGWMLQAASRPVASGAAPATATNYAYRLDGVVNTITVGYPATRVPAAATNRIYGKYAITFAAWINLTNFSVTVQNPIYSTRQYTTANTGFTLYIDNAGHPAMIDRINGVTLASAVSIATNSWNHVVWTHTNGAQKIYLNGVLLTNGTDAVTYEKTTEAWIGLEDNTASPAYQMRGAIAEACLLDRIWASNEVYDAYTLGNSGTFATNSIYPWNTNAVCIWQFNENTGTNFYDSCNSVTATLFQAASGVTGWTNAPTPYR
jgi:hypothetical protein